MSAADHPTMADRLSDALTDAIVDGEMPQGMKISEPELARRYKVSRGPLREAIRRLEGRGLIRHVPHAGARVVALTPDEVAEIYFVREALEGMAARLAARNMDDRAIRSLDQSLDAHERATDGPAGLAHLQDQGDLDFHYRIIQGSGNLKLISMLCGELYHLIRMLRLQSSRCASRPREALAEHRHIAAALAARDGELAEMLMRRHIARGRRNVERAMAATAQADAHG